MARRAKRETSSYLQAARELATFVPSLKKYKHRKTLNPWEKGAITRKERLVRGIPDLIPVTKREAKTSLKDLLYEPVTEVKSGKNKGKLIHHHGIQAIKFKNVGRDFKPIKIAKDIYSGYSNNRPWVYWKVPDTRGRTLAKAAERAFTEPESYEIERVIELARQAFEKPETKGVYLWTEDGRVGNPMTSLRQFTRWIIDDYSQYKETEKWVRGIAILVGDVGEKVSRSEWTSFGPPPVREKKRRR